MDQLTVRLGVAFRAPNLLRPRTAITHLGPEGHPWRDSFLFDLGFGAAIRTLTFANVPAL